MSSSLVDSAITSYILKSSTQLQIAIANFKAKEVHQSRPTHHFGLTIAYDEFKHIRSSAATAVHSCMNKIFENNGELIQAIGDNFDYDTSAPFGLKQTHCMAFIIKQDGNALCNSLPEEEIHVIP